MENEEQKKQDNADNAGIVPSARPPTTPYNSIEFDIFLKEIGNSNLQNWSILAQGLGVSDDTITRWKNHPLAKQALSAAIEQNLKKMEEAGSNDWKMFREKLKMFGIKDKTTLEHEGEMGLRVKSNDEVAKKLQEVINDDKPEENTSNSFDNK